MYALPYYTGLDFTPCMVFAGYDKLQHLPVWQMFHAVATGVEDWCYREAAVYQVLEAWCGVWRQDRHCSAEATQPRLILRGSAGTLDKCTAVRAFFAGMTAFFHSVLFCLSSPGVVSWYIFHLHARLQTWVEFLCFFYVIVFLGLLVHLQFCCVNYSSFSTILNEWLRRLSST